MVTLENFDPSTGSQLIFPSTTSMPLVQMSGEQIICSSRMIAEKFGRRHSDVLLDIEKLITDLAEVDSEDLLDSTEREIAFSDFFIPTTYVDAHNETQPMFRLW